MTTNKEIFLYSNQLLTNLTKFKIMKIKFLTIAAMVAFAMTSCGGKSDKATDSDDAARESVAEQAENVSDPYADDVIADDVVVDDEVMFENIPGDSEAEKVASKSDVDAMLNEYERFVDKYISLLKKASKGDVSAMADYASYMESAQSLGEKIDKCSGEMNAAQMKRYTEITNKMAKAASEMAGDAGVDMDAAMDQYMDALEGMNF